MQKLKLFFEKRSVFIILFIIFIIGAFLRVHNIESIHTINPDEAISAVDTILNTEETNSANSQSRYFSFLLSLSFAIFGTSIFSIKIVSVIIGVATILLTYLATKQLLLFAQHNPYSRTRVHFSSTAIEASSLLSAGFLASNILHIIISRGTYDAILAPFFLMFALTATFYSLRKQYVSGFILSGVLWGIGCYASSLFIISLPICIGILIAVIVSHSLKQRNKRLKLIHNSMIENERNNILILCTTLTLVLAPLLIKGFSFFTPQETTFLGTGKVISSILQNIKEIINILFINGVNTTPFETLNAPIIAQPLIPLFIFGIFYIIWTLYYAIYHKNNTLIISQFTLLASIVVLISPILFTSQINPNRFAVILPFVCIISSYGFLMIIRLIAPNKNKRKKIWIPAFSVALIFVAGLFFLQYNLYFVKIPEQKHISANAEKINEINNFIRSQANSTNIYILVNTKSTTTVPYPKELRNNNVNDLPYDGYLILLLQQINKDFPNKISYISETEIPRPINSPSIIIVFEKDKKIEEDIKNYYPQSIKGEQNNFWTYTI